MKLIILILILIISLIGQISVFGQHPNTQSYTLSPSSEMKESQTGRKSSVRLNILYLDDTDRYFEGLGEATSSIAGVTITHVDTIDAAFEVLRTNADINVIIADFELKDYDGTQKKLQDDNGVFFIKRVIESDIDYRGIVLFFSGAIGKVGKEIDRLSIKDVLREKYKYSVHSKKGDAHRDIYQSLVLEIRRYAAGLATSIDQDKTGISV